jgi:hypothetical protein
MLTLAIRHNIGPLADVSMNGRHIHHLVWGILLLLVVGYTWLVELGPALNRPLSGPDGSHLCSSEWLRH